jgi:hypothetical protein
MSRRRDRANGLRLGEASFKGHHGINNMVKKNKKIKQKAVRNNAEKGHKGVSEDGRDLQ